MRKFIIKKLSRFIYPLFKLYWFLFRPITQGAKIVLTYNNEILLIRHTYGYGWTFPGGGISKKEDKEDAVRREVREEIGTEINAINFIGSFESNFDYKRDTVFVFTGVVSSKKISIDELEIDIAQWFPINSIPPLAPNAQKIFKFYETYQSSKN